MHTVPLPEKDIHRLRDHAASENDFLLALYRFVFPEFDQMTKVDRPSVSEPTATLICQLFLTYPETPGVLLGGLWLNYGFDVDEGMPNWEVRV
jgi:hypothetical protein